MTILIDNGHGIETPGKASPDGTYREAAWARKCAGRIVAELLARGIDARLLVPETADISLAERVRRANDIAARQGARNVLLVSIHSNAAGSGADWCNARGWSIYTSPGQTAADPLATAIYHATERRLALAGYLRTFPAAAAASRQRPMRSDFADGDPDYEAKFYILTRTRCPAVLSENLFHDNRQDVQFLQSEAGLNAIVQGHVEGILAHLKTLKA